MKKVYYLSTIAALAISGSAFAKDGDNDNQPNSTPTSDSTLPEVSVNASDPVAFRGLSSGAFLLHRDGTNGDLAVNIILNGTGTNGVDYTTVPTTVTIPAGFFSLGLPINPLGSSASAPNLWVNLTIDTNANYRLGRPDHASVEIKGNVYEDQPPVVSITSPADNTGITAHSNLAITANATDANDIVSKVSFYANDKFLGTVTSSPYSITWSNVPPGTFALFARAEDQFGKSTLSSAVHVTATNPPPSTATVTLTAPSAGSSFGAGANITLAADVAGTGIQGVSFYNGDTLLGTDSTAPYSFSWNNVAPGHYNLRAKATESDGAVASSAAVKINVTNGLPTVKITSPTNNTTVGGPTDVTITAEASDSDGTVAKVNFYGDAKFLGSVTNVPYTVNWTNVVPGKHLIVASAADTFGGFTSSAVTINVTNPPPTVSITAPANNTTLVAPASVEIDATAADADGVQYVSFWSGDHQLGVDKTAPYSVSINNLNAGNYTITARAIDKYGQVTVSAPVKITVAKPIKP